MAKLAIQGGEPVLAAGNLNSDLFHWPIVTDEDIDAVVRILKAGTMSGTDETKTFEKEYAAWNGVKYALGTCNGTAAVTAATWACGVGAGDEVIAPSMTYWASCASVLQLGATVNFADIDPKTLCIDPKDIEHRIGPRTKAIIVVHYASMPADMDAIMAIARKHNVKVIEDNSHAQGAMYKGKMCGSLGDISAASLMAGKSLAVGEAGMITTSDRTLFERCIAFGHYERTGAPSRFNPPDAQIHLDELLPFKGLPMGGVKHRMNQTCAAMGRVQLKHYPERMAVIQEAMNYFADKIDTLPGVTTIRPVRDGMNTKGGWYASCASYNAAENGGVPAVKIAEAIRAENSYCFNGLNFPLHTHNYFHSVDFFNQGKPTALAFGQRDVRQGPGSLPNAESIKEIALAVPWFKHFDKAAIDQHFAAWEKVFAQSKSL